MAMTLSDAAENGLAALPFGLGESFGTALLAAFGCVLFALVLIALFARARGLSGGQIKTALLLCGSGFACIPGVFTAPLGVVLLLAGIAYACFARAPTSNS